MTSPRFSLQMTGSAADISRLRQSLEETYEVSERPVSHTQDLELDIGDVAAIVALVPVLATSQPLVPLLVKTLRGRRRDKIVLESKLGRVTVEAGRELTEDEIKKIVKKLGAIL